MNIIERGKQFVQQLRELAGRSAWDWRRCPRCGSRDTSKNGGRKVHPSNQSPFNERIPSTPRSLSAWGFHQSWLIRVAGTTSSYAWQTAALRASQEIHRLCSLLSLAWGTCWILRDSPRLAEWGEQPIPDWAPGSEASAPAFAGVPPQRLPVSVPG